jgi:hypothetical protein
MLPMKMTIAALLSLWAALSSPACGPSSELIAAKQPGDRPAEAQSPESQPPPGSTPEAEERPGAKLDPIAEEYLAEARVSLDRGEVASALVSLLRAGARSPGNKKVEKELEEITGSMRSEAYYTPETVQMGKGLSSPLQFVLTYRSGNEPVPLADIPVRFDFAKGSGVLTGEAVTNDLGIAKCYVESITDAAEGVLIVGRVVLRADDLAVEIDSLTRTYEFTSFSIFDTPHVLLISGDETHPLPEDVSKTMCGKVQALFSGKGFSRFACGTVTHPSLFRRAMELDRSAVRLLGDEQGAKVLLLLDVRPSFLSQPSSDFYFYRASLTVKMIDVQSFRLYFESTKEERGAGPTSDLAEQQAVGNALGRLSADLELYIATLR